MTRRLAVAAVTPEIELGDLPGNLARIRQAIERGVATGARLIVLPELATSGYVFADPAESRAAALTRDDPRLTGLAADLDPEVTVVLGYAEADGSQLYNSAAVLTPAGLIGHYRKSHLWAAEREFFVPGDTAGAVIDTPVGRLGVAICYDNEFPEVPRRVALAGADLLALPVNWPEVPRPEGEHPPETIQAMAAARSSRLPTIIADRTGAERGVRWTGGTAVINGDGWVVATPQDQVAAAVLELTEPGDKSLGPLNDLFRDRRPDLY